MRFVEDKILESGVIVNDDILKVDSFLNHQIDTEFALRIGKEFADSFGEFNKVLTIETSGVAFAITTAMAKGNCPIVFAKKSKSAIVDALSCYHADIKSFTRGVVSDVTVNKKYLNNGDKVLIVDDFLAEGNAALGLISIARQAGAEIVGVCAVINKIFQGGEKKINDLGIKVVSGARISSIENGDLKFE